MERGQQIFERFEEQQQQQHRRRIPPSYLPFKSYSRVQEDLEPRTGCPCPSNIHTRTCTRTCTRTFGELPIIGNKWKVVLDMEDFHLDEIKTKVDPIYHTLIVSAKHRTNRWGEEPIRPRVKRVIPLPENVNVNQLTSFVTPEGKLVLKAPYLKNRFTAATAGGDIDIIPITFKENTTLTNVTMQDFKRKCPVTQYLRLLKQVGQPGTIDTQCVKDDISGKWKVLIDIDTVGFLPEEVAVIFQEKERRLIVEGRQELEGVAAHMLRREFIVPEFFNVHQMQWRVMNNGILRIQLPCNRSPMETETAAGKYLVPTLQ